MLYKKLSEIEKNNPNHPAIIDDFGVKTYTQLLSDIHSLNTLLQLKKNDIVMAVIGNSAIFISLFFTVNFAEAIWMPISTKLTEYATHSYIKQITPSVIIADEVNINKIISYPVKCFHIYKVNMNDGVIENIILHPDINYVDSDDSFEKHFVLSTNPNNDRDRIAEILFTSGTTGIPKGIMLSNYNIISNVNSILNYMNISSKDIALVAKSMIHSSTINGEILTMLFAGGTIVTTNKLISTRLYENYITKYQITILFSVPALLTSFVNTYAKKEAVDSIRIVHFYGSTISNDTLTKVMDTFPKAEILYGYGLTEASPRVTCINKKDLICKIGSSGKPINSVSIKLLDSHGVQIKAINEVGEIYVNGPNVMQGYYKNPQLTKTVLTDDGLKTGDLGYFDDDGYIYILGRIDDMIIKNGINIYPAEIENILKTNDRVGEVLVKGENSNTHGNIIVAYIVKNGNLNEEDVYMHCKKYLEVSKIPDRIIFIKQMVLTESGKIKRK